MDEQNRILAGLILNCRPEDLKAISMRGDGSLAVVAPNGMKFIFSPVELENARDSFGLQEVSVPGATTAPSASTGSASGVGTPTLTPNASTTSTDSVIGVGSTGGTISAASTSVTSTGSVGRRPKAELVEAGKQALPHTHGRNRRQESRL
jgi:hypothetical protein